MKKIIVFSFLAVMASVMPACIKKGADQAATAPVVAKTPEEVVKEFVEASAAVRSDAERVRLAGLCAGEMRRTFERMSPEAFRLAYVNNHIKIRSLNITPAVMDSDTAKVSYAVEVDNLQGSDPTQETNEREVTLAKSQGTWFIDSIKPKGSDKIAFTRGMIF